jgi:hypothetical protein
MDSMLQDLILYYKNYIHLHVFVKEIIRYVNNYILFS